MTQVNDLPPWYGWPAGKIMLCRLPCGTIAAGLSDTVYGVPVVWFGDAYHEVDRLDGVIGCNPKTSASGVMSLIDQKFENAQDFVNQATSIQKVKIDVQA